jgi:hypothetical protein
MVTPSKRHGRVLFGLVTTCLAALATTLVSRPAPAGVGTGTAVSACGRHRLEVARGAVFVDGRRVSPAARDVHVLAPPTCRSDGSALAWLERGDGEIRLLVLPAMERHTDALPWRLASVASDDQVFWATRTRVVVGPSLLAPRAVASWSESVR